MEQLCAYTCEWEKPWTFFRQRFIFISSESASSIKCVNKLHDFISFKKLSMREWDVLFDKSTIPVCDSSLMHSKFVLLRRNKIYRLVSFYSQVKFEFINIFFYSFKKIINIFFLLEFCLFMCKLLTHVNETK